MGKRREYRVLVSVPVHVSGTDYNGNPFKQTAQTIDVSRTGARISGVRCLRGPGDMITIETGLYSARYRVVWVGIPGSSEDGHFGAKSLQPDRRIFRVDLSAAPPDNYTPPQHVPQNPVGQTASAQPAVPFSPVPKKPAAWEGDERRTSARIRCSGTGQMSQPGVSYPLWVRVTDISLGGCYLELISSVPKSSSLDLSLSIRGRTFTAKGTVMSSKPGLGIGVKFIELSDESRKSLLEVLQELTQQRRPAPPAWE